ncbi:MAG: hypothetical protein ACFFD9_01790, partial [Candidatus Thorarchaeota archaeon]
IPILLVGGVISVIVIGSVIFRRRRGEDAVPWKRDRGKSKEERRRQREEDERIDPKEYFGV